jgi:hypothetical protein
VRVEQISDLDEMLLRCRSGIAKAYAEEAVATYRAGAYRACVITTWIAVVFDLIDKIREIALFGNKEAKGAIEQFERWQGEIARHNLSVLKSSLEFERTLLDYVRDKFELIDGQQYIDLERLHEDRNRCAHPSLQREGTPYQPTGEVARAHLCNAIIHLLQQPPVQGRSALAELRRLILSSYFPREIGAARDALTDSVLARPSLVRGAVDEILFGFFDPGNTYYRNRRVYSALPAIAEIRRAVAEPRITEQTRKIFRSLDDKELPYAIALVVSVPECWRALFEVHRRKLTDYLSHGPVEMVATLAERASELDELRHAVAERVKLLDASQLAVFINGGMRELAVSRAVEIFSSCGSWAAANSAAHNLIIPLMMNIHPGHIKFIIESANAEGVDLCSSGGFAEFLKRVREEHLIQEDDLDALLVTNHLDPWADRRN